MLSLDQPSAADLYRPIARRSLHDAVLERLRDMIVEGQLPQGGRINEVALGLSLGVSRTPLREAIKTLTSEGLVEAVPARGAVVRSFTLDDVADHLDVLKSLEQTAALLVCKVASVAAMAQLLGLHAAMMQHYALRDRLNYFKLNQAIHSGIAELSGNKVLAQLHGGLQARIRRIRFVGHEGEAKWADAVAEHVEMAGALERRDGSALAEVLGRHLDGALLRVRDVI